MSKNARQGLLRLGSTAMGAHSLVRHINVLLCPIPGKVILFIVLIDVALYPTSNTQISEDLRCACMYSPVEVIVFINNRRSRWVCGGMDAFGRGTGWRSGFIDRSRVFAPDSLMQRSVRRALSRTIGVIILCCTIAECEQCKHG